MSRTVLMLLHSNYCKPPNRKLARYAESLYARKHECQLVARQVVHQDNWQPQPNRCHSNALILETFGLGYKAVHGWLFVDFDCTRDFVRFTAHSVVMTAEGQLLDVTPYPPGAPWYLFIAANLNDRDYETVLDTLLKKFGTTECLDYLI